MTTVHSILRWPDVRWLSPPRESIVIAAVVIAGTLPALILVLAGAAGPFDPENFIGNDAARLAAGSARAYPPPLFAGLLAFLNATFGTAPPALFAFNLVTHAVAVYAAYALARAFLGPAWSAAATLLFAWHPSVVGNIALIRFESLNTPLVALALLATVRLLDAPTVRRGVLTGLIWTAANFVKPITLLFPLAAIPLIVWRRHGRRLALPVAALAIVGVLGYAPWVMRNQFEYGVTGLSARYLWYGTADQTFNRDASVGLKREQEVAAQLQDQAANANEGRAALESNQLANALGNIAANPWSWLGGRVDAAYRLWSEPGVEWNWGLRDKGFPLEYRELWGFAPAVRFQRVLLSVALAGLLVALWRRDRRLLLLGAFLAYFTAVYAVTITSPRYFVVALPAVTVLAAFALRALACALPRAKRPAMASGVAGAGVAVLAIWTLGVEPGRPLALPDGDFEAAQADSAWQTQAWRANGDDPVAIVNAPGGGRAAEIDLRAEPLLAERRIVQVIGAEPGHTYDVGVTYRYAEARGPNAYLRLFGLERTDSDSVFRPRVDLPLQPVSGTWNHVVARVQLRPTESLLAVALGARWQEPAVWVDDVHVIDRPGWVSSLRPGGGYLARFWLPVAAVVGAAGAMSAWLTRRRPAVGAAVGAAGFAYLAAYGTYASVAIVWPMLVP